MPAIRRDLTALSMYKTMCRKGGHRHLPLVEKQLSGSIFRVRHRSIGPSEARPLAMALTVGQSYSTPNSLFRGLLFI